MDTRPTMFEVVSFGCKVNQAEGRALAARLRDAGLVEADAKVVEDAARRLVIVNTCAVTAEAARQGRQRIRRAVRDGAGVVVTGCAAHPAAGADALAGIGDVRLVEADKDRVVETLRRDEAASTARAGPASVEPTSVTAGLRQAPRLTTTRSRAMLKVQDGCPDACAYCIVPLVRPTVRSTPPEETVRQLAALVAEGYR